MHKKENFYIKLLTNVGNPDFKQDPTKRVWGTNEIKNVGHKKLFSQKFIKIINTLDTSHTTEDFGERNILSHN